MIILWLLLIRWLLRIIGTGMMIVGIVFFVKSRKKPHNSNKQVVFALIMMAGIFLWIISGRIEYEIPEPSVRDAIERYKSEYGET